MRLLFALLASVTLLSAQTAPYAPKQSDRAFAITITTGRYHFDHSNCSGYPPPSAKVLLNHPPTSS